MKALGGLRGGHGCPGEDAAERPSKGRETEFEPTCTRTQPHDRELLLDLIGDACPFQRAAAIWTVRGQGHVDRFINVRRRLAMPAPSMAAADAATGRLG
jgi:hypothetical protein